MFKVLLIVFTLLLQLHAVTLADYYKLSESQRTKLYIVYLRGQADKVGFELASIGWEESGAGNVRVNTNFTNKTPSVDLGFFMLNSISFLDRYYKEHPEKVRNHYLDNLLLDKIMTDDKFAQKYATKELKEWKSRGRNRKDMIKSYNCGTKIKRTKCEQYYNRVHQKMKILEKVYK